MAELEGFTSLLIEFLSYQDNGRVIIKALCNETPYVRFQKKRDFSGVQSHMRSHSVGPEMWIPLVPYIVCANSEASSEPAQMCRLA